MKRQSKPRGEAVEGAHQRPLVEKHRRSRAPSARLHGPQVRQQHIKDRQASLQASLQASFCSQTVPSFSKAFSLRPLSMQAGRRAGSQSARQRIRVAAVVMGGVLPPRPAAHAVMPRHRRQRLPWPWSSRPAGAPCRKPCGCRVRLLWPHLPPWFRDLHGRNKIVVCVNTKAAMAD